MEENTATQRAADLDSIPQILNPSRPPEATDPPQTLQLQAMDRSPTPQPKAPATTIAQQKSDETPKRQRRPRRRRCVACADFDLRCERDINNLEGPCNRCAQTFQECVAPVGYRKKSKVVQQSGAGEANVDGFPNHFKRPRGRQSLAASSQKISRHLSPCTAGVGPGTTCGCDRNRVSETCKICVQNNQSWSEMERQTSSKNPDSQSNVQFSFPPLDQLPPLDRDLTLNQFSSSSQFSPYDSHLANNERAKYSGIGNLEFNGGGGFRRSVGYVSPYRAQPIQDSRLRVSYEHPNATLGDDHETRLIDQNSTTSAPLWRPTRLSQSTPVIPSILALPEVANELDEDVTDANFDYGDLQSAFSNFEEAFRQYSSDEDSQVEGTGLRGPGRPRRRIGISTTKGNRGPRKAAEPTGDIKIRLSKASQAFLEEKYDEAMACLWEVIRINAETHEAWTLMASIYEEMGDVDKTVSCLIYAAYLRPKDVQQWVNCARFALDASGNQRSKFLNAAHLCYSNAIRADPKNCCEARLGKAAVLKESGNSTQAITEYRRVLSDRPHDTAILRSLAECYIDRDDAAAAIELYQQSIAFFKATDELSSQTFDWSDVNIYVELYGYLGQYGDAVKELRSLSRWLLGRQDESHWDSQGDDREWDADNTRRLHVSHFNIEKSDSDLYGLGLPLELRVKLGTYRLHLGHNEESLSHLLWLDPGNLSRENRISEYSDLFLDAANSLREAGLPHEALKYYKALQSLPETDVSLHLQIGICYMETNLHEEAEECFQTIIQLDENHIEARLQLAKLYELLDEQEQAFVYVAEVMNIRKMKNAQSPDRAQKEHSSTGGEAIMNAPSARKRYYQPRRRRDPLELALRDKNLREQWTVMQLEKESMRAGHEGATKAWMCAAHNLIQDFRGFKKFYPWDKYARFLGYTGFAKTTGATPLDVDIANMASRLSDRLGADIDVKSNRNVNISENYRGISFTDWLDIFLEYALCLAKVGRAREAYETCEAAKDAVVFYHSREDMFLIHVCWCTCALLANDETSCVSTCRYFTKEYQFTTDSYRMYMAITRLCQSPVSCYSSGPTQKHMLRQIKAMDYALVDKATQAKINGERAAYSAQDEAGHLIINKQLDVALLMLYGHILYTGSSYTHALNYFFRAYALDPENPMINLSVGLGYVHCALKRQSENRQFNIMQGLTFLFRYYDSRLASSKLEERQEAHYNMARTYHTLGLTHLALPYYLKVLEELDDKEKRGREDLVCDAAFNLQSLYAMSGNFEMAKVMTNSWLVV